MDYGGFMIFFFESYGPSSTGTFHVPKGKSKFHWNVLNESFPSISVYKLATVMTYQKPAQKSWPVRSMSRSLL